MVELFCIAECVLLSNNGFQLFSTMVISYPDHSVPVWSFCTHFYFDFGHFVPSLVVSFRVWSFRT